MYGCSAAYAGAACVIALLRLNCSYDPKNWTDADIDAAIGEGDEGLELPEKREGEVLDENATIQVDLVTRSHLAAIQLT